MGEPKSKFKSRKLREREREDSDDLDEKELDIKLDITKKSRKINRPVQFGDQPGRILEEIPTDTKILSQYIAKTPISRVIQCSSVYAESQINTIRAEFTSQGMNHCEGGWPKDVNPLETDQTMRFRKKVEKDENYVKTVCNLSNMMESCIKQNNAIEIYEEYFTEIDEATDCEAPKAKTVNLFRDQESLKLISWKRPVSSLAWCPDGERIAITYCSLEFLGVMADTPKTSYIFHIDDPTHPDIVLTPPFHLVSSEFNPKDGNLLAGGCNNGQVCWWDGRKGGKPEGEISLDHSHTEPVYKTKWVSSKTCSQFFSASTDGLVKWWDIRKFTIPVETLELGPANSGGELTQIQGATCLEYEPTIPTKFMVGTDQGMVLACNRKAKSDNERIVGIYQAHFGPVYALERNPCFPKNFLTIGDWCARLWSEDIKESAIMWTSSYTENLRDGCWSPTRPSVFFTARQDGVLDTWDILYQQRTPILSTKITDDALNCVKVQNPSKVHEQGCLVAIGCNNGNVSLIELSESLSTSHKNEKSSVTAMFERETRREKILEARAKELRLKEKTKGMAGLSSQMMQRKKQSGPPGAPGAQDGGEDPALQGLSANMNRPSVGRGRGGAKKKRLGFQSAFELYKTKAAKNGSQGDDDEQEDPCVRAEREFYQMINEEKTKRIDMNKDIKPDVENL